MLTSKPSKPSKRSLSQFRLSAATQVYVPPGDSTYAISYSDGLAIENYLFRVIKNAANLSSDSDELIDAVKDWPTLYHLGSGRANILRALGLQPNATVLELGSGCGAVTRYLGENFKHVDAIEGSLLRAWITRERCRDLSNVRVFCSNINSVYFDPIYDIVTLIGVLEYSPLYFGEGSSTPEDACLALLTLAKTALKREGILIIAIENKVGLKYWSGCPEDHTGKIFDGLYGYPQKSSPITFSKAEICRLLAKAGFKNICFFYCFPDYKFATTVISDVGNEADFFLHNWIETPFAFYQNRQYCYSIPRTFFMHEGLVIRTLSNANLLRQLANSFLILAWSDNCTQSEVDPDWIIKKFSTQRVKPFQCVTTLKYKPTLYIEKHPIYRTTDAYSVSNGDFTLTHRVQNSQWHKGDLMLFDAYDALFKRDFKKAVMKVVKKYYHELINRYYTGREDQEGYPLLCGESIDFILRNIIKCNGHFVAIDNEWRISEPIPADYVLYRCIMHDVIGPQRPWLQDKNLLIQILREIFPNFKESRLARAASFEQSFSDLVYGKKLVNYAVS